MATRSRPSSDDTVWRLYRLCNFALVPNGQIFRCACGDWVHLSDTCAVRCGKCDEDLCKVCYSATPHVCRTSDDVREEEEEEEEDQVSEDDSDGEQAAMVAQEAELSLGKEDRFLVRGASDGSDAAFPEGGHSSQ